MASSSVIQNTISTVTRIAAIGICFINSYEIINDLNALANAEKDEEFHAKVVKLSNLKVPEVLSADVEKCNMVDVFAAIKRGNLRNWRPTTFYCGHHIHEAREWTWEVMQIVSCNG